MHDNRIMTCFTIIDCSRALFDKCVDELQSGECSPERAEQLRKIAVAQRERIKRKRDELHQLGAI